MGTRDDVRCHYCDQRMDAEKINADLLATCEAAVGPLELYHAYGWPDANRIIAKLRAAIAKARGSA